MVQLALTISPHVEGGNSLIHSVIDVRQAAIDEVEAMKVVQLLGRSYVMSQYFSSVIITGKNYQHSK